MWKYFSNFSRLQVFFPFRASSSLSISHKETKRSFQRNIFLFVHWKDGIIGKGNKKKCGKNAEKILPAGIAWIFEHQNKNAEEKVEVEKEKFRCIKCTANKENKECESREWGIMDTSSNGIGSLRLALFFLYMFLCVVFCSHTSFVVVVVIARNEFFFQLDVFFLIFVVVVVRLYLTRAIFYVLLFDAFSCVFFLSIFALRCIV